MHTGSAIWPRPPQVCGSIHIAVSDVSEWTIVDLRGLKAKAEGNSVDIVAQR